MGTDEVGHGTTARLVAAVLESAGVTDPSTAQVTPLTGGTYNTVVRVVLADGRHWVVKIPPPGDVPALQYERGLLRGEVTFSAFAAATGVPVPEVVHAVLDPAPPGVPHLVMTAVPGVPWPERDAAMPAVEKQRLRYAVGESVARLHGVTGPGYGYPARPLGPLLATWREAFTAMTDAVLDDAVRHGVRLPRSAAEIRTLLHAASGVLGDVTRPALVHFDLWEGNLLLDGPADAPVLGGIVDGERMFWGDPVADFVSLALFDSVEHDEAFLAGYAAGGGHAAFDASVRLRLALYRCYLYLIMTVEPVPRGYGPEHVAWTRDTVGPQLEAALRDVARG